MQKNRDRILHLTQLSLLSALLIIMSATPLGFVMIPPVAITLMHIPVIIGAILMGPLYGGILGGVFGLIAMFKATTSATSPVDMMFSPFLSGNPAASIAMCLLPRILLGVSAALLFLWLQKAFKREMLATGVAAALATVLHTGLVMGCLSVFFSALPLQEVFLTIVGLNGLLEVAAAVLLAGALCKPLRKILQSRRT